MLKKMLVFNPKKRIRVDECLAHPLFKDLRNSSVETVADTRVTLPFDDWQSMDQNQLRYDTCIWLSPKLSSIRYAFLKETQVFHKDLRIPEFLEKVGYSK